MAVIQLNDVFRLHGKALTILRINNDLKVIDVAKALGVTPAHISQCEKSIKKLSAVKTKQFLELVGISEDEAKAFVQIIEN
jgi:transcriptional regulator with XRE-family HTH domain